MLKRVICLVAVVFVLLTGCSKDSKTQTIEGTTCANITMGNGEFAYYDGMIYFTDYYNIFEYSTETDKLIGFDSNHMRVMNLMVSQDNIYFKSDGINCITKNGKKSRLLFDRDGLCTHTYIEGNTAFYLDGICGDFISRNISQSTEALIDKNVISYYVDNNNVYYITDVNNSKRLKVYDRETLQTDIIHLTFEPVTVIANANKLYLTKSEEYQLLCISNGSEIVLPINAYFFQVIGDKIFYLDENTLNNSCCSLKMYDIVTGTVDLLYENVFCFCVLEDRYVCVHIGTYDEKYAFFDLANQKKTLMYSKAAD